MTQLPVEMEGETQHAVTFVSKGGQVVGKWTSPGLTLIPAKGFRPEEGCYHIFPTGVLEVQTLTQASGQFMNEGKILKEA